MNNRIKMPYHESEQYLDELIERSTKAAMQKRMPILRYATIAATIAAAVILLWNIIPAPDSGMTCQNSIVQADKTGPIDKFISSLTDEEAEQIICYDLEEIPEY